MPAYSAGRSNHPPPLHIDRSRDVEPSPYSWDSHKSDQRLMGPTPSPPPIVHTNPPPVPSHGTQHANRRDDYASHARPQRPGGPLDPSLRRSSALKHRSTLEIAADVLSDTVDEDDNLFRENYQASRNLQNGTRDQHPGSPAATLRPTPVKEVCRMPSASSDQDIDHTLFDPSIAESALLATQLSQREASPPPERPRNKIMTPAQFERAKYDQERLIISRGQKDEDEDLDDYEDDEDEAERLKKLAKQRKAQDAQLAVFRQGMMKTTGEPVDPAPRPNIMSYSSAPNLTMGGLAIEDDSDSDEDTPLAILKEHGFPNKNRHPSHAGNMIPTGGSRPSSRAGTIGGGGGGGGGNLPVFARHLPQDPYFGASVVNPLNRSGFGAGSASSHGGDNFGGGLIGVIENEERARAARRGGPNAPRAFSSYGFGTNGFGPNGSHHTGAGAMGMGIPQNMHPNMQQPMMNPMGPMPMGPMGPMMNSMMNPMMAAPMMPPMGIPQQTPQDQMDFMQMQMQMQWMQMMNGGVPGPGSVIGSRPATGQRMGSGMTANGAPTLNLPGIGGTPQIPQNTGRAMSLMDVNTAPWRSSMSNYTPSIAPSERSNVGLSARYRPVSNATDHENAPNGDSSRTASFTGVLGNRWSEGPMAAKGTSSLATSTTVRANARAANEPEEDEEAAWAAMKAKREKKKGFWKDKKEDNAIKSMLAGFE